MTDEELDVRGWGVECRAGNHARCGMKPCACPHHDAPVVLAAVGASASGGNPSASLGNVREIPVGLHVIHDDAVVVS